VAHWFQGNNTEFTAFDDPPTACIAANFNNNSGIGTIVSGCSRLKQRLVRRRSAVGLKPAPLRHKHESSVSSGHEWQSRDMTSSPFRQELPNMFFTLLLSTLELLNASTRFKKLD